MNILIFGLPGSGKTTFAKELCKDLDVAYFNGDQVRTMFNDWRFDSGSRGTQAYRMQKLCSIANKNCVVDFICPYDKFRNHYNITVWINTIKEGRFENTNKIFEKPTKADFEIVDYNYEKIIKQFREIINEK